MPANVRRLSLRPNEFHGGDDWCEEVDKARRFIRNDVFFQDELQKIGEGLKSTTITNAIGTESSLNEAQDPAFRQHGVGNNQQHHDKNDCDGDKPQDYVENLIHLFKV